MLFFNPHEGIRGILLYKYTRIVFVVLPKLGNWDVSSVTNMEEMFEHDYVFNQPLNSWDVSNVENMDRMFLQAGKFNQPLDNWDISSVVSMHAMFYSADSFGQPLGSWDVSNARYLDNMLAYTTISEANYDNLLLGWSQLYLQHGVSFNAGNTICSSVGEDAKQYIIDTYGWIIQDGSTEDTYSPKIPGFNICILLGVTGITLAVGALQMRLKIDRPTKSKV